MVLGLRKKLEQGLKYRFVAMYQSIFSSAHKYVATYDTNQYSSKYIIYLHTYTMNQHRIRLVYIAHIKWYGLVFKILNSSVQPIATPGCSYLEGNEKVKIKQVLKNINLLCSSLIIISTLRKLCNQLDSNKLWSLVLPMPPKMLNVKSFISQCHKQRTPCGLPFFYSMDGINYIGVK